ncbi:MAG: hypothetical protein Q9211_004226 [Gyalolechia sp. 1 TL-2023]
MPPSPDPPSIDDLTSDLSPDSPPIDDLIARRTGSRRHVTIPGFTRLPRSKQLAICARLKQIDDAPAVDGHALHARLLSLSSALVTATPLPPLPPSSPSTAPTSPPDLEAEMERDRLLEELARKRLEQDGCPPCYPANPSFLLQDPPQSHSGIIAYWKAFPTSEGGVLCAQWEDWHIFRKFQERSRLYFAQKKSFSQFTDAVRDRRQRHHLPEDVDPQPDPGQQSRQETWVEFQNYHLHMQEQLENERQVETDNLHTAQISKDEAPSEYEHATSCLNGHRVRLESATQRMELHERLLLPWIEQRRMQNIADGLGSRDDQFDMIRRIPEPGIRKRTSKVRSVLNPVRSAVSKPTPRKPTRRSQRSGLSPGVVRRAYASSTTSITSRVPDLRASNTREAREIKWGSKSMERANDKAHLRPLTQPRKRIPENGYHAERTGIKEA